MGFSAFMRNSLGFALAVALALPANAAAAEPLELRSFPHAKSGPGLAAPSSDGHRYLVFNQSPGTIRVYDTRMNSSRDFSVPADCQAIDATRNAALVNCADKIGPYVLDLRAFVMWAPFGARPRLPSDDSASTTPTSYSRIGRHWMQGGYCGMGGKCHTVWSNWRTRDSRDHVDEHDDFAGIRDLNSPDLDAAPSGGWSTYTSEGPYVLLDQGRYVDGRARVTLVLKRGSRRTALGRSSGSPSLSAGLVTWRRGRTVLGFDVKTRARSAWAAQDLDPYLRVLHTSTHVVTAAYDADSGGRYRVRWARIPR
jgi:hypothetical protein